MIDIDKYEGHTEGEWEYDSATIHATAKGGNEIIAEYPCWNYNKDQLITKEEEANLRLMADAPLLLQEVKRLQEALKEAVIVVKEMENMAYADAYNPTILNHALEFIGNVTELIK
jgi:cellobiose-specific phosphotransferase system component IIB